MCWQTATMCLIESWSTLIKNPYVALHINLFSLKVNERAKGRLKWCDAPWGHVSTINQNLAALPWIHTEVA